VRVRERKLERWNDNKKTATTSSTTITRTTTPTQTKIEEDREIGKG